MFGEFGIEIPFGENQPFVYIIDPPDFSKSAYYAYFYDLTRCIIHGSTIIGEEVEGKVKYYDRHDICEKLDISKSAFYRFINECYEKEFVVKTKDGKYRVNPSSVMSDVFPNQKEIEFWSSRFPKCKKFFEEVTEDTFK